MDTPWGVGWRPELIKSGIIPLSSGINTTFLDTSLCSDTSLQHLVLKALYMYTCLRSVKQRPSLRAAHLQAEAEVVAAAEQRLEAARDVAKVAPRSHRHSEFRFRKWRH